MAPDFRPCRSSKSSGRCGGMPGNTGRPPGSLTRLARLNHATAVSAAERLGAIPGVKLVNHSFFNEFALRLSKPAALVVDALAARGILAGVPVGRFYPDRADLADLLLVAATETVTADDIERLAGGLTEVLR